LIETYPDLLSKSFFPDENVTIGTEALQRAIYCQNPPLISLLVGAGVPLNHAAKGDYPAVVEATQFGAQWIVDYLFKIGAKKCGLEETEEQTEDPADSDEVSDTYRGGDKSLKADMAVGWETLKIPVLLRPGSIKMWHKVTA